MSQDCSKKENFSEVLEIASMAGHIMLENGAEIARVEETMERISAHWGVTSRNFFVLSNGIFTTGDQGSESGGKDHFANVEFIPIKGTQMDKIVETNRLSRDIEAGCCDLATARVRLAQIRAMKPKPAWEQILGSAVGSSAFCAIFGGGFAECLACLLIGALLWMSVLWLTPGFSKILGNIINGALAAALCFLCYLVFPQMSTGNMVVGALIPLIPGVAFTNGIRDIANEDYIAGVTRLMDALMVFFSIAMGACLVFVLYGRLSGADVMLHGAFTSPQTDSLLIQFLAGLAGTTAFAVLFGTPRREYLTSGLVGALGWGIYYVLVKYARLSALESTFLASVSIAFMARNAAKIRKCPITVFLICGLFPLIPGGGIFWTIYSLVSRQFPQALDYGFVSLSAAVAIVLAIVVVTGLPKKLFKLRRAS